MNYEDNARLLEKKSTKRANFGIMLSAIGVLLLMMCFLIWCFYHEPKVVSGQSMQPTINETYSEINNQFDIVLVNKTQNIERQDIVIIDFSEYKKESELIIKRVIAKEGDSIKIVWEKPETYSMYKSVVYLKKSGESEFHRLDENYTKTEIQLGRKTCAETFHEGATTGKTSGYEWNKEGYILNEDGSITIQKGFFFALGDNRELSLDSSEVGPFQIAKVQGVAETIVPDGSFLNKLLRKMFNFSLKSHSE